MPTRLHEIEEQLFERLVEDPDATGGLSPAAKEAEPENFLRHVGSLASTKLSDGLIDPKLVLSWLLNHLGAGAFWTGLLVPVRESGALLPQLFTAGAIGALPRRKWVWAAGSAVQGLAALAIVLAGLWLQGALAGGVIVGLLGVLALARSACSVAHKDVLGKTVGQSRRGTATGLASSVASVGVILFALVLLWGGIDRYTLVIGAIALAGMFWLLAAWIFAGIEEEAQPREDVMSVGQALGQLRLLRDDPQLGRFVAARSALVGTALAPPYLLVLAEGDRTDTRVLGLMVLASAVASLVSSYVWGRLSDRSSRLVLFWSGIAAATALGLGLLLWWAGFGTSIFAIPLVLFGLMIAYQGVRQGRSTYLVDMSPKGKRPAYTAVSNLVVGLWLLVAGAAAAALASVGIGWTIAVFALASLLGSWIAWGLDEVSG